MTFFLTNKLTIAAILSCSLMFCKKNTGPAIAQLIFDTIPVSHELHPVIREVSGIADSQVNPGFLWAHEDSGNPTQLYLISHEGEVVRKIFLKGITNRDWEDMALFNNEIYLAETGDNAQVFSAYKFYKFPEPLFATDTVHNIETISFTYPDGSHDAEAFVVDPASKDIYIITKRDNPSRVYRLSYPYTGSSVIAINSGSLPYSGVVGAALSTDGSEIMVKTYSSLFYYTRKPGQSIMDALSYTYTKFPCVAEPQGEAVGFARDGSGFLSLSEQAWATSVNLYFYKRY